MKIEHLPDEHRFVARVGDEEAELAYELVPPKRMDIQHTFVPAAARGQGVAEALAMAAFELARNQGYEVVPTCPFVRRWLRHRPDELALVAPEYRAAIARRPGR